MATKRDRRLLENLEGDNPSLKLLILSGEFTAEFAAVLASNTTVRAVCFGSMDTRATARLVQVLRVNTTIKELFFGETGMSGEDIALICDVIATTNSKVRHLEFSNERNINQAADALARLLMAPSPLRSLDLRDNKFSFYAIQQLAKGLAVNVSLRRLNLEGCYLGRTKGKIIADALFCCCLREIILDRNKLDDNAVFSLVRALSPSSGSSSLTTLSLNENRITSAGAKGIARLLGRPDVSLKTLFLYDNQIDDEGVLAIARALCANTTLTNLGIGRNPISRSGATPLAAALTQNKTLTDLSLVGVPISDATSAAFLNVLAFTNGTLGCLFVDRATRHFDSLVYFCHQNQKLKVKV